MASKQVSRIEQIKSAGAKEALFKAVSSSLWDVRHYAEDAGKDQFKNFPAALIKARKALDDAEQIYQALRAHK